MSMVMACLNCCLHAAAIFREVVKDCQFEIRFILCLFLLPCNTTGFISLFALGFHSAFFYMLACVFFYFVSYPNKFSVAKQYREYYLFLVQQPFYCSSGKEFHIHVVNSVPVRWFPLFLHLTNATFIDTWPKPTKSTPILWSLI